MIKKSELTHATIVIFLIIATVLTLGSYIHGFFTHPELTTSIEIIRAYFPFYGTGCFFILMTIPLMELRAYFAKQENEQI